MSSSAARRAASNLAIAGGKGLRGAAGGDGGHRLQCSYCRPRWPPSMSLHSFARTAVGIARPSSSRDYDDNDDGRDGRRRYDVQCDIFDWHRHDRLCLVGPGGSSVLSSVGALRAMSSTAAGDGSRGPTSSSHNRTHSTAPADFTKTDGHHRRRDDAGRDDGTSSSGGSGVDNMKERAENMKERATAARDRAKEHVETTIKPAAKRGANTARELASRYGAVFVGTYLGVYVATLASLFAGIDSGLIDPVTVTSWFGGGGGAEGSAVDAAGDAVEAASSFSDDVKAESKDAVSVIASYLERHSWTRPYAGAVERNPHVANLAIAWVATKFTEPLRLGATIAVVPRIARALGRVPKEETEVKIGADRATNESDGDGTGKGIM